MSDYYLNVNRRIYLSDFSNISDYLELVGKNDRLNITLKNQNIEDYNLLCRILKEKKFHVICNDEYNENMFFITAYKNEYQKN